MLGPGARLSEDGDDIGQRLLGLADEVVSLEGRRGAVPADLAGDEDQRATRGDAVGIAPGLRPGFRVQGAVHAASCQSLLSC